MLHRHGKPRPPGRRKGKATPFEAPRLVIRSVEPLMSGDSQVRTNKRRRLLTASFATRFARNSAFLPDGSPRRKAWASMRPA